MSDNKEKQIEQLRNQIDLLDTQLLDLISKRAEYATEIAKVKQQGHDAAPGNQQASCYRPEREAKILRRVQAENQGPLDSESISMLFREIMSACLALEEVVAVGFLGPKGTFTHIAALKHFGHAVNAVSLSSIDEVFNQAEAKKIAYGVVPIENSTEGVVSNTLDCLVDSPLKIVGEVEVRIHHNLIGVAEDLSLIKTIVSHQQSFSQCRQWLAEHLPGKEHIYTSSTAAAVLLAKKSPHSVAIAGEDAAERYDLSVMRSHIEDDSDNTTRFLIVGQQLVAASGQDKTSILVSAQNRPGALSNLLQPLARHNVSMTRIESRPTKSINWEYMFFIDLQGHYQDQSLNKALEELKEKAEFFKLLGSYPVAIL